jgi:GAF domain-containing protein
VLEQGINGLATVTQSTECNLAVKHHTGLLEVAKMKDNLNPLNRNVYHNMVMGATPNPVMPNPDEIDEVFADRANEVLGAGVELARELIGAHQSAIAIVVQKDWSSVRNFFSISPKYAAWADYRMPAKGAGIHNWVLEHNAPIRLTQAELESHPAWKGFGSEAGQHPPMRGWLAAPLIDRQGINWGLIQLSDKYEGDFNAEDERNLVDFAHLISMHLETLWELRNLQKAASSRADNPDDALA